MLLSPFETALIMESIRAGSLIYALRIAECGLVVRHWTVRVSLPSYILKLLVDAVGSCSLVLWPRKLDQSVSPILTYSVPKPVSSHPWES